MLDRTRPYALVVDDERAFADIIAELLDGEGYRVEVAHDGLQALEMLTVSGRIPDVIVCDVMLPSMSGAQLAVEVRRRFPHSARRRVPIILLSASADPCIELPDVSFMSKPVDLVELVRAIEQARQPRAPRVWARH
jgi:two-component system, OmpR family, response regulator CpxR